MGKNPFPPDILKLKKCVVTNKPAVHQAKCCADSAYRPISKEISESMDVAIKEWLGDYDRSTQASVPYDHVFLCMKVNCARCGGPASEQWFVGDIDHTTYSAMAVPMCIECDIDLNDRYLEMLKDKDRAKKMVAYIQKKAPWLIRNYQHYITELGMQVRVFQYD